MVIANAVAEGFAMADVAGIDRADLCKVMAAGPLHSGMMDFIEAYGIDGDPNKLAFTARKAAKGVGYYQTMVEETGRDSITVKGALEALNLARDAGQTEDMVSQMVDFHVARFER